MTPTPPPKYRLLSDEEISTMRREGRKLPKGTLVKDYFAEHREAFTWERVHKEEQMPFTGAEYAVPLSAEETTVSAPTQGESQELKPCRDPFDHDANASKCAECGNDLYAGCPSCAKDNLALLRTQLAQARKRASVAESTLARITPPSAPTQEPAKCDGFCGGSCRDPKCTAPRGTMQEAKEQMDEARIAIATLERELKEAREERGAIARMIGREPDEIESGDLLSAVSSMKMAIEISGKQFQENQNALAESERKREEQNWLYEHDLETERNRTKALQSELSALQAKVEAATKELENIRDAKWRQWSDGMNTPDQFVLWAQNRARHTLAALSPNPTPEKP